MPCADMGREQAVENRGAPRQRLQGEFAQGVVAIHQEQQTRHEEWRPADLAMPRLIAREIALS